MTTGRIRADPLARGLRALTLLARCGPLDLAGFARANHLPPQQAVALIALFEANGLVHGVAEDGVFTATPLAAALTGQPGACRCETRH